MIQTPSSAPSSARNAGPGTGKISFREQVLRSRRPVALPIAVYPGAALNGQSVLDVVTKPEAQATAALAMHQRYATPVLLSAMDLSVEAEAFGATVNFSPDEIPTITGRLIETSEQATGLGVPELTRGRVPVYLETVRRLVGSANGKIVLAGTIGPFSLAGRLAGVSEALELTATEPELMHLLLSKCAEFLCAYANALKSAGASGLIMAEPAAGLLSPRSCSVFSSAYIQQIIGAVESPDFELVLHNCAAKPVHLPAILESGAKAFHFGAPMDLQIALQKIPGHCVVCGNLDPAAVFVRSSPAEVTEQTAALRKLAAAHPNFVLSSGCDVPAQAPLANLDAFFAAAG